jgi:predicted nucleic acid-binding protein
VSTFLDTNIPVYAYDHGSTWKRRRAVEILASHPDRLVVSSQVLSEFYWAVTRKLDPPLAAEAALEATQKLAALPVVASDRALVLSAIETSRRHQISLWDALIVEAAARGGCDCLLTEDLNDGQEIRGIRIENPFQGSPR